MNNLLEVENLVKFFPVKDGVFQRTVGQVHAVDGVSFNLERGKTLGLVGESGCGKTTVGRTILRLTDPTSGVVRFDGQDIASLPRRRLRELRPRMQIVFQDPMSSLNPRMTVRQILREPLSLNGWSRPKADGRLVDVLNKVGMNEAQADRYPHEFSGGQRQRIGIARALVLDPDFVVLDEPTSALDVSVQAQVLNLLKKLQKEMNLTYLFISHDLSVVRHMCDDIAIMYLGKIAEKAPASEVFEAPQHPYTHALFSAIPVPDPTRKAVRVLLEGDVPSPINPPEGCRFHPRCSRATVECRTREPPLERKRVSGHLAACFHPGVPDDWTGVSGTVRRRVDDDGASEDDEKANA